MCCTEILRSSLSQMNSNLSASSLKIVKEGTRMLMCPFLLAPGTALVRSWRWRPHNVPMLLVVWWPWYQWVYKKLETWCDCCWPPKVLSVVSPVSLVLELQQFFSLQRFPFFPRPSAYQSGLSPLLPVCHGSCCVKTRLLPAFCSLLWDGKAVHRGAR